MNSPDKKIIHQGNSVITTEIHPDYSQPVVIKKPSDQDSSGWNLRTLEREYEMTRSLDSVEGVRKALGKKMVEDQQVLILEYIDGETLQDLISRNKLGIRSKLEIAIDLARILGKIHRQNIIHLDINSKNILIKKKRREVHIIDLGSALYIDRNGNLKVQPDQPLENLSYISPEQTGRINRPMDERSDLYSLGVVLYELMTGQLPFDSIDPMELVHHHIARVPGSPSEVRSEIPEVLSAIILKLLSKNEEKRYQSATGIQADLENCLQGLSTDNTIEVFPLGETDYSTRLRFPQKLYGRDRELEELVSAFESVCRGTFSIMFVGGYSGIGKTVLVEEVQQQVSEKNGFFIKGKFDQLTTTPYSGIAQALTQFVSQILTQTETQLSLWRSRILETVGPNGRVLTDVVPSLELVIGFQPAVPELSGKEAQNRFDYVFQLFFEAIAHSEHPMCFFLDDLQWIDPGSLGLLKALLTSPDLAHLLIVGAYRDNEVNEAHPLMTLIADLEKADVKLNRMTLQKLSEADVDALISNALRLDPVEVQEIARLVYSQTNGNPFFTRQVLRGMEEKELIALDTATGHWRWDMDALKGQDVTADVAELVVGRLKELPVDIQETLKVAACIGNQFDIATLRVVTEGDNDVILDHVRKAVVAGLLWERHKRGFFVHDRVQEAAYTLMPPEDRGRTHLTIGRLLLAETDDTDLEERILEIVTHYNQGVNLLTDPSEKLELVRLNLVAGHKARLAAAFAASAEYLKQGVSLLGEGVWQDHYKLTLDVHSELIEVYYLNVQYLEVEALFDAISENTKQDVDAGVAYKTLIMSYVARHELGKAISLAEHYLERLDVTLESELKSDLSIAELIDLSIMEDKEKLAAMEILMVMTTPVLFSEPERLQSVFNTMLTLIRRYGNNSISAYAYAAHAYSLCLMQRYQEGNRFGQMVVDLLEKYPNPGRAAGIMNTLYTNVRHWRQPIRDQITPLKTCHRMAMQAGDFEYALYSLMNYTFMLLGSGKLLEHCLAEFELTISLSESKNQQFTYQIALMLAQFALNLTGRSPGTTQLEGKWFSEESMMSRLEGNHQLLAVYGLLKMMLCYLFGDPGAAYLQTQDVLKYGKSLNPNYLYTKIPFYGALSCIAGIPDGESDAVRQERLGNLTLFEEELKLWADSGPMNYQHQYDLVLAEKCRISDKNREAVQLYEQAIWGSQKNKFLQDEALANELYGQFWLDRGNNKIAEMYIREARTLYQQWGAAAKVDHLESHFPQWFKTKTILAGKPDAADSTGKPETTISQPISSILLDLDTLTSASQMLSAETNLEQLLSKMITIVMANSGAETAVLLLKQDNDWFLQARGDVSLKDQEVLLNQPLDSVAADGTVLVPESVHHFCRRSKEVLVVGDARSDNRFTKDKTVLARNIKSMACIPVMARGECKSMLYLENCQVPDTFSEERIELLMHLSTQFGISVENALLNANLNKKIQELEESELLFRSFVENANETIVVSQDATVKYCNEKVRELTGYTSAEIRSQHFGVFIHPEDLDKVLSEFRARVSGQKATGKYSIRIITKNGMEKHILVSSAIINWDGNPATLAMLTDITELKQTEANLGKSEKQFRRLMEQSPLAIELLEPNGQVNRVNRAWRKLWGISKEDATRVLAKYNMLTDPQIKDQGLAHLVEKAFSGQSVVLPPFQYDPNRTLDDYKIEEIKGLKQAWIQCHLYSIKDSKGEILQVVNIYVDITELKYVEMEVQKQKEMLALVGRASRMGQLTGSIAHELNQPLTGILSNAQAAELMMKNNLWEKEGLRDIIGDIISDTKRAGEVIRNLRHLYREQKIEFHPIDINSVLDDALRLLHSEFIMQHVKLTQELDSSLPPVNGNRIQIQQVVVNLFMNSFQALSGMANENRQIHVKSAFHKNKIYVWIEDNGTGIKPEKMDQIFEPLATWKPGGTGMGLAISKSIIESHGGKIKAENRDEGGARIGFILPALKEDNQ